MATIKVISGSESIREGSYAYSPFKQKAAKLGSSFELKGATVNMVANGLFRVDLNLSWPNGETIGVRVSKNLGLQLTTSARNGWPKKKITTSLVAWVALGLIISACVWAAMMA